MVRQADPHPEADVDAQWNTYLAGTGTLARKRGALRFLNVNTTRRQMTNAQIDDYQGLSRRQYRWRPPLTLSVRARFSHPDGVLSGTAGFGFWNDPFLMTGWRAPALPRALWFFYASPPSDMRLVQGVPGRGWKAAAIDAGRPRAVLWAPLAPILVPLMNVRPLYRRLWPHIQRSLGIGEAQVEAGMQDWHTYTLEWQVDRARFSVDERLALDCAAPRGPLGFVAWLDNQYMVVTPWGGVGYGWLDAPGEQWMEIEKLEIAGLCHSRALWAGIQGQAVDSRQEHSGMTDRGGVIPGRTMRRPSSSGCSRCGTAIISCSGRSSPTSRRKTIVRRSPSETGRR